MAGYIAKPDLKFLFMKEEVHEDIQKQLIDSGVTSVKQFAALVKDADEMRELAADQFGLGDMKILANKVKMSNLVCAYNSSKARSSEIDKVDAENDVRQVPKIIAGRDFLTMRAAYKAKYGNLDDDRCPARSYIERKLDDLEKGDFRAETLSEVVNYRQDESRELQPVWDSSGSFRAIKTSARAALPNNSEELRARITLMGTAWIFTSFQQTANHLLKDLDPSIFISYLDYLLGKHVWGLRCKAANGETFGGPSWHLLLSYEHELRVEAYSLMCNEHYTLKAAFASVVKDLDLKGRYLITPLALEKPPPRGVSRPHDLSQSYAPEAYDSRAASSGPPNKKKKGNHKGGGKGGGKGKKGGGGKGGGKKGGSRNGGMKGNNGCASKTPKGDSICYNFNSHRGCEDHECTFAHVCGKCFKHGVSMQDCKCA